MVILSGITGFLGGHLVRSLKEVTEVIGISGRSGKYDDDSVRQVTPEEIAGLREHVEAVVMSHAVVSSGSFQASEQELFEGNVAFTKKMVETFPDAYHVYISSVSVYGNSRIISDEDSPVSPVSGYAISKLWGEKVVLANPGSAVLRLPSLFGIHMKENTIVPNYVNQALKKKLIEVWGKGERLQNYLSARAATLYIEKMLEKKPGGIYLGLDTEERSNADLAYSIAAVTGADTTFIGEDHSSSSAFSNHKTIAALDIKNLPEFNSELFNYIDWKRKQF